MSARLSKNELPPAVRQYPTIRQYMTPAPHTIARHRSLAAARKAMLDYHVRHFPVIEEGKIVGLLSERDLLLVEALPNVNPTNVRVEEAMVEEVYTVTPDTPIGDVVETMINRKLGSAVVVEDDHVVGVFTTIDALRALQNLLEL
jgi:acetoin utilization protein AcuB